MSAKYLLSSSEMLPSARRKLLPSMTRGHMAMARVSRGLKGWQGCQGLSECQVMLGSSNMLPSMKRRCVAMVRVSRGSGCQGDLQWGSYAPSLPSFG